MTNMTMTMDTSPVAKSKDVVAKPAAGVKAALVGQLVEQLTGVGGLLQRYYGLDLVDAGVIGGVVIGVTGLIGLLIGGRVLDRAARKLLTARVRVAAYSLAAAAVFALAGLTANREVLWQLVLFLSLAAMPAEGAFRTTFKSVWKMGLVRSA